MAKFVTIGERLSTTAPAVNKAFTERDPEPIIKRAKQQLDAGATYLEPLIYQPRSDSFHWRRSCSQHASRRHSDDTARIHMLRQKSHT